MHIHELLPLGARPAIERAMRARLSYRARFLVAPGARPRALVILGEAHVKLGTAAVLGRDVVNRFELRGVETFQSQQVFAGRVLGFLVHAPRIILRVGSFGLIKGSTITDAKAIETGHTDELERSDAVPLALHAASAYLAVVFAAVYGMFVVEFLGEVPPWFRAIVFAFQCHMVLLLPAYLLRRQPWAWIVHPALGLVTVRDALMAEGTVRMLRDHPDADAAVVVMGRAHLPGYEAELVEKHGFVRAEL